MRRGITLTEVLVAIFIMAIGMLALLTLFPVGLLSFGQAIKDDRATQGAHQADAFMRWYWKDKILSQPNPAEPFFVALSNPGTPLPPIPANDTLASYPVLVDPIGVSMRTSPNTDWVGDGGQGTGTDQTNIPRRTLSMITNVPQATQPALALRACSLMDTIGYQANGEPLPGSDMRAIQYNWTWLLQRKNNSDQFTVEMTILVFDKRVAGFLPSASEKTFTPSTADQKVLTFPQSAAPNVQKGGWLLDVSSTTTGNNPGVRNANFYRVVSVTPDTTNGTASVELQTPLKDHSGNTNGFAITDWRFAVVDGLYEVFEMQPLTR